MGAIVVSPLIHHVAAHPLPSNVQILLIDRRIHFVDSKARPAALSLTRPSLQKMAARFAQFRKDANIWPRSAGSASNVGTGSRFAS
jgi:hypothetical protein